MLNQVSLFDIQEYTSKKLRGCYKKHPKPAPVLDPWEEMKNLYQKLAGYVERPLFVSEDIVFTRGIIRAWLSTYTDEAFTYEGEICPGECFQVFEAELIGTENLYLEDRISIHKEFLSYLESNATMEEAEKLIKSKFKGVFG